VPPPEAGIDSVRFWEFRFQNRDVPNTCGNKGEPALAGWKEKLKKRWPSTVSRLNSVEFWVRPLYMPKPPRIANYRHGVRRGTRHPFRGYLKSGSGRAFARRHFACFRSLTLANECVSYGW
jgi:hypothetical protein